MVDDRGYGIESRRNISLNCGGGEGVKWVEEGNRSGYTRKKGRSSQSDSPDTVLEHEINALTEIHRFDSGDENTSRGSTAFLG